MVQWVRSQDEESLFLSVIRCYIVNAIRLTSNPMRQHFPASGAGRGFSEYFYLFQLY